jgi:hypothetical protein
MPSAETIDALIRSALGALVEDSHVKDWWAKENNWVSYFAFKYLVDHCRRFGIDPAQIGVEVSVPQAPGRKTRGVRKDIVIWPKPGMTCWLEGWKAGCHPTAIMEWKVHRPFRRNPLVHLERKWLKDYCKKNRAVLAYAVEVDGTQQPLSMKCWRFFGRQSTEKPWREFEWK